MIDIIDPYMSTTGIVQGHAIFMALQQDDKGKVDSEEVQEVMNKLDELQVEKKTTMKKDLKTPPRPSFKSYLKNLQNWR